MYKLAAFITSGSNVSAAPGNYIQDSFCVTFSTEMSDVPEFLKGDPKRQAIPTLRGFSYQIWQSVYRWLKLNEGEFLFLEGAEDIDLLGPGRAEAIQVKEARGSGPVTLQTKDVLEAVGHFWGHQKNNPPVVVTFRFLTTAERGHERSRYFGDIRGLDYWDSCKFPGTDPSRLRSFLIEQQTLPEGLRSFVAACSDRELRDQLITRIEWDTGSKSQPFVEELVNEKVATYGDRVYNLPPAESAKVVPHLLQHAWDTVRRADDRRLSYLNFMEVFQQVASETVSKQEINFLRGVLTQSLSGGDTPPGRGRQAGPRLLSESIFEPVYPPLNARMVPRADLVARLHARLNTDGILVLRGSTGMGKSTLSLAVANSDGAQWRMLDMRGRTPEQIYDRLAFATRSIEDQVGAVNCIIDDLNFDRNPALYETALAKFIYAVTLTAGRLIITTQGNLPPFVVTQNDVPQGSLFEVPALDEGEIVELLRNYGCPAGNLAGWGRTIFLFTSGHPLLAHARVKRLQAAGWPSPTPEDFSVTRGIEDVRREIRRRLQEQLPFDAARTLAYRLSVLTRRFRRVHALYMAQHPPGLATPGEAFDSLVGPWVEEVGDAHFRLSPLLDGAAPEVFPAQEVKALHATAAAAFLSTRKVTPVELDAVLFHGLLGEAKKETGTALALSHEVNEEYWPEYCRVIDWFGYFRLQPGERLFAPDLVLSIWLRRLQFMVADQTDGGLALRVFEAWEREIEEWDGQSPYRSTKESAQFGLFNAALSSERATFPIKTIVEYVVQILILLKDVEKVFPGDPSEGEIFSPEVTKIVGDGSNYIRAAALRCKRPEDVVDFLTAWDEQEADVADAAWELLGRDDYFATSLVDGIWLREIKSSSSDWTRLIDIFERIAELGLKRSASALTAAAYRGEAIVFMEYLNDTEAAVRTLAEAEGKIGRPHLVLQDYRAKIHFIEKNYAEAFSVWDEILPRLESEQNPIRTFSYRDAEISAALLGDWKKAAEFALGGERAARQSLTAAVPGGVRPEHVSVITAGFRADYAFALWKSGDRVRALYLFAEVLNSLESLPDPRGNIRSYMLNKFVGHGIGWLAQTVDRETEYPEPPPGFFSTQEVVEEIKDYPLHPHVMLWYLLAKVEYVLNCGDTIFRRFEEEHRRLKIPDSKVGYLDLRVRYALKNGEFEHLVSLLMEWLTYFREYAASLNMEKDTFSDRLVVISLLLAALTKIVGEGSRRPVPLKEWQDNAEKWGLLDGQLGAWFDYVEKSIGADSAELTKSFYDESLAVEVRNVTALILSVNEWVGPEVRFYANVGLVTTNFLDSWRAETEEIIASIVSRSWLEVAERERFSLRAPAVTAAPIIEACRDESVRGLRKAARVLLTVKDAVWSPIDEETLTNLKEKAL